MNKQHREQCYENTTKDRELERFAERSEGRLLRRAIQNAKVEGRMEPAKHRLGKGVEVRRGRTLGIF